MASIYTDTRDKLKKYGAGKIPGSTMLLENNHLLGLFVQLERGVRDQDFHAVARWAAEIENHLEVLGRSGLMLITYLYLAFSHNTTVTVNESQPPDAPSTTIKFDKSMSFNEIAIWSWAHMKYKENVDWCKKAIASYAEKELSKSA